MVCCVRWIYLNHNSECFVVNRHKSRDSGCFDGHKSRDDVIRSIKWVSYFAEWMCILRRCLWTQFRPHGQQRDHALWMRNSIVPTWPSFDHQLIETESLASRAIACSIWQFSGESQGCFSIRITKRLTWNVPLWRYPIVFALHSDGSSIILDRRIHTLQRCIQGNVYFRIKTEFIQNLTVFPWSTRPDETSA